MKDYQKEREQMEDMKVMEYLKDKQVIKTFFIFSLEMFEMFLIFSVLFFI